MTAGCLAAAVLTAGCGVTDKKLGDVEARIKALQDKGVPDTVLADVQVNLFQVKTAKQKGSLAYVKKEIKGTFDGIVKAEGWYAEQIAKVRPEVQQIRAEIATKRQGLSGLPLKMADSLLALVDDLIAKDWMFQARVKIGLLDEITDSLVVLEKRAGELRPKVVGTWYGERQPSEEGMKAVEKGRYSFKPDGKLEMTEELKGQTTKYLKEDWKFNSWGTWDLMGDTIFLFITREQCERQVFQHKKNSKWEVKQQPTYDTTVVGGTKDRLMTWQYLTDIYKKTK